MPGKKVLYLINYAGNGGTENFIKTVIDRLGDEIEPHFIYNEPGALVEWMTGRGIPTSQIMMTSPFDFRAAKAVAAYCKENGIDIIHTQFLRENYIAMLSRLIYPRTRAINSFHILTPVSSSIRICNRLISCLQDTVTSVCTPGVELLAANGVPKSKIKLLYNAVEPEYWGDGAKSNLRTELGISEDTFVMLYAARLADGKGHEYLLRAAGKMQGDFCLVLAGDGAKETELRELAQELALSERVRFLGFRNDMKNLYTGADVTVCPSESEALSFMILESLASGTPVVATRVGGNPDIISGEDDGGMLVEYGDSDGLAAALEKLRTDKALRRRLSENGKARIKSAFHIDAFAAAMSELYGGKNAQKGGNGI